MRGPMWHNAASGSIGYYNQGFLSWGPRTVSAWATAANELALRKKSIKNMWFAEMPRARFARARRFGVIVTESREL